MSNSISNPGNYLRTSRNFPHDPQALSVELTKSYIDIANQVNDRISGVFGTSTTITGESWFLAGDNSRQQTLRQVYSINGVGSYVHNINFSSISRFSRIYGAFTNGTNWYPLPYVDGSGQIGITVDPTNIILTSSGTTPSISNGQVVLEWLSNF